MWDKVNVKTITNEHPFTFEVSKVRLIKVRDNRFNCIFRGLEVRIKVFNAIVNNISAMSWWSVLLVGEIEVLGENHRPTTSH